MRHSLTLLLTGFALVSASLLIYWARNEDYFSKPHLWISGSFWTLANESAREKRGSVNESKGDIWFLETSYKRTLNAREACSIESSCRYNSDYTVHLLSTGKMNSSECPYYRVLLKIPNFRSSGLNASAELAGTPLAPLHATGGALHRSPYIVAHLSDFLRYVVLWNRGGVYLDSDVIVMKSLRGIRNAAFYQSRIQGDAVANGILFFDKKHPFLKALIDRCARVYNPGAWTSCGPSIMSALATDAEFSHSVKFLNESVFFAVPWQKWENLFNPGLAPEVLRAVNSSYGVHFWNNLSKKKRVVTGSGSAIDVLARTHCPLVYRIASFNASF